MADSGLLVDAVRFNDVWGTARFSEDMTRFEFEAVKPNTQAMAHSVAGDMEIKYGDIPAELRLEH